MPCSSDPVRGMILSLSADYKQSLFGPGPSLGKISLIKKKRADLCWPIKLFQVSLRNRLLINQRPVQMLNGWYQGFRYLRRFWELLFVWHLHSRLWYRVVRSQVGLLRHLLVRARNFKQKREQKKIHVFRFHIGKEIIKHCSSVHLLLFLKGKRDFGRIYAFHSMSSVLYVSKPQCVSGMNEPLSLSYSWFFPQERSKKR